MEKRTILDTLASKPLSTGVLNESALSFACTEDGHRLFLRDVGAGRSVVFIHGWTLSSEIWRGQLDWLAGQGLRAVAYDRRGHGHSDRPSGGYDYDTLSSDLAVVLDRLDLRDVTLVAHSMGAGEAVRYLARYGTERIARLLLVAPTTPFALKTDDNPEGVDKAIYDKLVAALKVDREAYLASGTTGLLGSNPSREVVDWAMSIALKAAPEAQVQCLRAFSETDLRPDLKAVTVPTLIQYGTADTPIMPLNARRTQQGIAGSHVEIYEGAPHALFLTDMERFNQDLLQFARS